MYRRTSVRLLHSEDDPKNPSKAVVTMTDYTNMSAEAEAALVPDWVHEDDSGDWSDMEETVSVNLVRPVHDLEFLQIDGVRREDVPGMVVVLQFFAANGRLPGRRGV